MLVMVVFFIAFRWIHLSTPLIRLVRVVLTLLLLASLHVLPGWFALSLLRFRLPSRLPMMFILWFLFLSRRRHTRSLCDWSSDVCSSDLLIISKKTGEWGVPYPGAEMDALRADMNASSTSSPVENLTIAFDKGEKDCTLRIEWENSRSEERRVGKEGRDLR